MKLHFRFISAAVAALLLTFPLTSFSQPEKDIDPDGPGYAENCTSIMVGRLASTDGSVMTSHTCDGRYRTWLEVVPAMTFERDTVHHVYWGTLFTEESWDMTNVTRKGEIPEVKSTYAFLSTAYPCLNEKQLAIGETTIYGRKELINTEGLFLIEELEKIALQRCTTARQAIALIGSLAEQYGYGDLAECITIADPREVWQLEIAGSGPGKPSSLWVAQRIPDDHVGIAANIPRISDVNFKDPDRFMTSTDLRKKAKELGYWDGKEAFKFYKVIGTGKPYAIREFFVLNTLAPELNLTMEMEELPFTVKPEKKLSVSDVMALFRETYEGTPYDMTKNLLVSITRRDESGNPVTDTVKSPIAFNWMSTDMRNLVNELRPGTIERQRTIAIAGCSYSHVIQCREWLSDEVGAVAWFSFDNPGQSPRIPIFSGTMALPKGFSICGQHRYREDAALWAFREANRLSTVNWERGRKLIEPAVADMEQKALAELPALEERVKNLVSEGRNEEARKTVTEYTNAFAHGAMSRWQELRRELWQMFGRGF
ncbi:MAG: C69 family dipeptidase [Bacteroidales bacterium]|nr:C69 family dipeptidase [Bacteroidales bacterium]MDT8372558.1 C69 family dipeptidase [Bacteroidales bacterium]